MKWMNDSKVIVVGCGVSEVNIMEYDLDVHFYVLRFYEERVYEWMSCIKEYEISGSVIVHWKLYGKLTEHLLK